MKKKTTSKKAIKKVVKKASPKSRAAKKSEVFNLKVKSTFLVEGLEQPETRQIRYKAVCTLEQKDLTGWTDENIADSAAENHRQDFLHPVTVLELH